MHHHFRIADTPKNIFYFFGLPFDSCGIKPQNSHKKNLELK